MCPERPRRGEPRRAAVICIRKVEDLVGLARARRAPVTVACAVPEDRESLEALRLAADQGIARPLAVGQRQAIEAAAEDLGLSLDGFEFHEAPDSEAAARSASALVHDGRAAVLMKGRLATKTMIRAVLDHDIGLRRGRMLSHVALFDAPSLDRPVVLTDAGVNIRPNLAQKIEIIRNAAEVMQRLGVECPRVAILAAVGRVELPAMPATLDAKLLERMGKAGRLGHVIVQGPLALDGAVSPEVVRVKGLSGPVVGQADILVVPEIETGNIFYKALTCFGGFEGASLIWGARAPVVVTSRTDTARMKFLSVAFAAMVEE